MLLNYFKIALRNITRSFSYSMINISGLTLGITCAFLIFSMIAYHLQFDDFHHEDDRIYRFVTEQHRDQISYTGSVPPAFGLAFRNDYTFGEKVARICTLDEQLISVEENGHQKKFKEDVSFAEPEFFQIFNFPIVAGYHKNILVEPNTALITEQMAKKYFGEQSPLNKTFRFNNSLDFKIVGVLKNFPDHTDFQSQIYFSYSTIGKYNEWYAADDAWGGITGDIQTFARLRPGVSIPEVEKVLPAYVKNTGPKAKMYIIINCSHLATFILIRSMEV